MSMNADDAGRASYRGSIAAQHVPSSRTLEVFRDPLSIFERDFVDGRTVARASLGDCRAGLQEVGTRIQLAGELLVDAREDQRKWVRAAKRAEISVAEIARLTGVTRPTVYAMLRD